ncbi:MAG TPA: hypothetical protein VF683_04875, partial [Chthoniobacterales bacterium]
MSPLSGAPRGVEVFGFPQSEQPAIRTTVPAPVRIVFKALHLTAAELVQWPLLWGVAFAVPLALVGFLLVRLELHRRLRRWEMPLLQAAALGLIGTFVAAATIYLFSASFDDHVEPLVAVNAWRFWQGEPIYHALETEQRHTTPYGPYLYMLHALAQAALGPSTLSSKLMSVLASVGSLIFLYAAIARATSRSNGLLFTGLAAALSLPFEHVAFWNRTDPFLIFGVTVALFAATHRGLAAATAFGAAVGIAIGMKTHGGFYFIAAAVLAWRNGWRTREVMIAAVTAVAFAVLPFAVFPHVSFQNFLFSVNLAASYSVTAPESLRCLAWLITLFIPAVAPALLAIGTNRAAAPPADLRSWAFLAAILVSSIPVLVPAAQMGSGPHHFLPFIPLLMFFAAEQTHRRGAIAWRSTAGMVFAQSMRYSWLLSCALVALWMSYARAEHSFRTRERFLAYTRDVRDALAAHPDKTLLMAVGGDAEYWHAAVR